MDDTSIHGDWYVIGALLAIALLVVLASGASYKLGHIDGRLSMPIVCGEDAVRVAPGARKDTTGWPR